MADTRRKGKGKLRIRRRITGKSGGVKSAGALKPSSSSNTGSAGQTVIKPQSNQDSSPQSSIQPDFVGSANNGEADDSSWQPEGWDSDNSDYDDSDPSSKANTDDKDRSNAQENSPNEPQNDWAPPTGDPQDPKKSPDVAEAEKNADPSSGNNELPVTKEEGGLYNDNGDESVFDKAKKRVTKKRAAVAFGLGGGLIGGFFGFMVVSGPLQIVHFAQLLEQFHFTNQQELGDDRTSRILFRYAKSGNIQQTRLGLIGNRAASSFERQLINKGGVRPVYTVDGKFAGVEILDESKARSVVSDIDSADSPNDRVTRVDGSSTEGRVVRVDGNDRNRRSAINSILRNTEMSKVSQAVSSRLLKKLGGVDFHPFKTIRRPTESALAYRQRAKERVKTDLENGVRDRADRQIQGDADTDVDGDGANDISEANQEAADFGNDASQEASDAVNGDPDGRRSRLKSVGSSLISKAAGPAAVVGVLCAVKDIGSQAEEIQFQNTILPMMRTGFRWMSMGSQLMAFANPGADLNFEEIGVFADDLFDEESGSVFAAASMQSEMDQEITGPDIDPSIKPSSIDGKPLLFSALDQVPALGSACNVNNAIGSIPVIGSVLAAPEAVISGALSAVGLPTPEDLALSVATWLSGEAVNPYAVGSALGNIANYGARIAANTQFFGLGGVALSVGESLALDNHNREIRQEQQSNMSLFARLFDTSNVNSLASSIVRIYPRSSTELVANTLGGVGSLVSGPLNLLSGRAEAQESSTYDYGFPEFGFSLEEQQSEIVQDPYQNASVVEADIDRFDEEYGKCFPVKVGTGSQNLIVETDYAKSSPFNQNDDCTEFMGDDDYLRYRFYLHDLITAHSLDCYEGSAESCSIIGINSAPAVDSNGASGTDNCSAIIGNERIACAAKKYFGVRYANYNAGTGNKWLDEWGVENITGSLGQRPQQWVNERIVGGDNDFMECSGYTNVAIYEAFGVEIGPTCSAGYLSRTDFFEQIDAVDAQKGDFVIKSRQCGNNGHIGILDERLPNGELLVMESSAGRNDDGEKKSGFYTRSSDYYPYAVRYIGPGSSDE